MASLTIILDQKEKSHSQTFLTIPKREAQKTFMGIYGSFMIIFDQKKKVLHSIACNTYYLILIT